VLSHDVLVNFLKDTEIVKIREEDGTAIGDAIALAAARLKKAEEEIQRRKMQLSQGSSIEQEDTEADFKIKNKVIILLTDGQYNAGEKTPIEAAEQAKKWGIKIYTIGIGSTTKRGFFGFAMDTQLDEQLLKAVAEKTGGFYGKATDAKTLRNVVEKIDSMEKTKINSVQYTEYEDKFWYWAFAALAVLAFEILAGCTIFRKIP
jgi:Ca-activated chloride channel family protein